MATTTNFGWTTPDDTSLVKDGAAAIRTLGQSIDTSMMDLEGGTTGQVLSKASNADMDFTWVTTDDTNAIQNAIVDAKGDLIAATAADTPARLAVGANDTVLTADSTAATGLKWAAVSAGGYTLLNSGNTALTGTSVVVSSIPGTYQELVVVITGASLATASYMKLLPNGATSVTDSVWTSYPVGSSLSQSLNANDGALLTSTNMVANNSASSWVITIPNYSQTSANKIFSGIGNYTDSSNVRYNFWNWMYKATTAITSLTFNASGQSFNGGNVYVYGVK